VATVSRVVNEKGPVREATRCRIRRLVEKLRYVPHGAARSLITRKTHTLGVLLPDLFGEFFSELIRGIDAAVRRRGYHLLVSGYHEDPAETREVLRAIRGRVDGLIALSPQLDQRTFEENLPEGVPVVFLNAAVSRRGSVSIRVDNSGGAFAMARHLLGLGHRKIAFVTGPAGNHDARERLRGFRQALKGRSGEGPVVIAGDFREETGYQAAPRMLAAVPPPTAAFAANDAMAIGLLSAFRELRVQVPEDMALAGFDDIPIARFITPPLTTVRVPIAELGSRAAARLFEVLDEEPAPRRREEVLPTTLVIRASCGAPGKTKVDAIPKEEAMPAILRKEEGR
jgi:LacI family transcriptional regulator, galactose operon repressor